MSDLLGVAGLFLGVLGFLYGAWYADLERASSATVPDYREDSAAIRRLVDGVLATKAMPLAAGATALFVILLPDAIAVLHEAWLDLSQHTWGSWRYYSSVKALFCLVVVASGWLALHLLATIWKLRGVRQQLTKR